MTDEEMAEEYVKKEGFCSGTFGELDNITSSEANKEIEQAFLAGLKAGRPQWHDLQEDKNDLPPKMLGNSNFSIEVLSDKGELVNYNFHYCEWFYWRRGSPIAWCEIPTFDKE
jgi:hypothetical protein